MFSRRGRSVDDYLTFNRTQNLVRDGLAWEIQAKLTSRYIDGTWRLLGEGKERRVRGKERELQ